MKKKPVTVLIGLAVAAVAVVAGLTKDKWLGGDPQKVAVIEAPAEPQAEPSAPATPQPEQSAATTEQPATQPDQPAAAAGQAAVQPEEQQAAAPEQPASEPEQATTEVQQPAAQPEQQTAQPEQPAVEPQPQPEQQVAGTEPPTGAAPSKSDLTAEGEQVPAFDTVRVEKSGEAVIAGTAEAGSEVVVKLDGKEIGKTVANPDGAFVVVPEQPLPEGSGALTIESKGKGDAEVTASEQVVAVVVPDQAAKQEPLVAVVSPGEPTKVLQKPDVQTEPQQEQQVAAAQPEPAEPAAQPEPKPAAAAPRQVSLDAVDYDETGNIVFSGRAEPGLGVRIYVDNGHLGDTTTDQDGRWQYAGTADISAGVHTLRVDGIDANGKVLNRVEVPFFREESRKVATAAAEPETAVPAQPEEAVEPQPAGTVAPQAEVEGQVPAPSESQVAAAVAKPKDGRVVIQPGNNLWRISKVLYGTGTKFTVIYEANKDQIRNPDRIYPGQVFMTPDAVPPGETVDPKLREPLAQPTDGGSGQ